MTYTAPVLSGSVPNPVAQPLQGLLTWTPSVQAVSPTIETTSIFTTPVMPAMNSENGSQTATISVQTILANLLVVTVLYNLTSRGSIEVLSITGAGLAFTQQTRIVNYNSGEGSGFEIWTAPVESAISPSTLTVNLNTSGGNPPDAVSVSAYGVINGNQTTPISNIVYSEAGAPLSVSYTAPAGAVLISSQIQETASAITSPTGFSLVIAQISVSPSRAIEGRIDYEVLTSAISGATITSSISTGSYPIFAVYTLTGGSSSAPGYDVYRDGASIATFTGSALTYTDNVPAAGTYGYNVAAWGVADPNTLLLQHFDTGISDSTSNNIPFTLLSPAVIGATNVSGNAPQFGTGCLNCPYAAGSGANDVCYSEIAPGGLLDLSSVPNWTIEFWINPGATGNSTQDYFGIGRMHNGYPNNAGLQLGNAGGTGVLQVQLYGSTTGGGADPICQVFGFTGATWHHVAIVKTNLSGTSDQLQIFLDGVASVAVASTGPYATWGGSGPPTSTGEGSGLPGFFVYGGYYDQGYGDFISGNVCVASPGVSFDECRVSNVARYSANFTPPTAPFSLIAGDISAQSNTVYLTYGGATGGPPAFLNDEFICGAVFGGVLNLVEFVYMPNRAPFLEGATNMILNRYKQEPNDVRQRGVDYTFFLVPGELVQDVTVSGIYVQGVLQTLTDPLVTPLVVSDLIIDPLGAKFAYTVSGGQDGIEYSVQFTTVTQLQTSNVTEIFSINILIEDSFP